MSYSLNYKNHLPYSKWYEDMNSLREHIEERCMEITTKYNQQKEIYMQVLCKEYAKGEDVGKAFEQNYSPSLEIILKQNEELISLEKEIKSTLEKTLKDIINKSILSKKKRPYESYINFYIREIEERKEINMSNFSKQKKSIDEMNKKRNDSEHNKDSVLRDINVDYIINTVKDTFDYMNELIKKLYEKNKYKLSYTRKCGRAAR